MDGAVRISATFPRDLIERFDDVIRDVGYESRSKALQDSVKMFISEFEWLRKAEGFKTGVLVMIYDHEMRGLNEDLIDIQHKYTSLIQATMHIHLSKDKCLEVIAVKGEAGDIRRLAEDLKTRRGVEEVRVTVVSI